METKDENQGDTISKDQNQEMPIPVATDTKMAADGASRVSSGKSKPGSAKSCLVEQGSSRPQTEGSQRKVRFSASSTASRAKSAVPDTLEVSKEEEDKSMALVCQDFGQGDFDNENINNSNNTGRTEPLRMSINDMKFGFENPDEAKTVRTSQKFHPRSAHKTWEDLQKPDSNVSDLAISGKGTEDADEGQVSAKVTKKNRRGSSRKANSAAVRIYNRFV